MKSSADANHLRGVARNTYYLSDNRELSCSYKAKLFYQAEMT